ncbi:MAG: NADPH-dependent 7-cyano-7-deazaguanine reductase QueF [Pseudomonadota bacterium]
MMENPLGRYTEYPSRYAPDVLFPVPRATNRRHLPLSADVFAGHDLWHAYELSWLDSHGMPRVAVARFAVPQESPNLVESKSLKLYCNSLNQTRFAGPDDVRECIARDLAAVVGTEVGVELLSVTAVPTDDAALEGSVRLEEEPVLPAGWQPDAGLLAVDRTRAVRESLHSHLFRSNCPITGQPDWGTVMVSYRGGAIDHPGLLRYILSYREHQGYHEDCVERIFCDLWQRCEPDWLVVGIQFLRRGGLDINPWRWSVDCPADALPAADIRLARQ